MFLPQKLHTKPQTKTKINRYKNGIQHTNEKDQENKELLRGMFLQFLSHKL
jgi:hypothetical protein